MQTAKHQTAIQRIQVPAVTKHAIFYIFNVDFILFMKSRFYINKNQQPGERWKQVTMKIAAL